MLAKPVPLSFSEGALRKTSRCQCMRNCKVDRLQLGQPHARQQTLLQNPPQAGCRNGTTKHSSATRVAIDFHID